MAGRPKYEFTEEQIAQIDDLALLNCKDYTIAMVIDCDVATLKAHYSKRLIQKRAEGRARLRLYQVNMAKNNPAMAIFLGKNELGQEDKKTIKNEGAITHELSPELRALAKKVAIQYAQEAK